MTGGKLVRDRIPQIIEANDGAPPNIRTATAEELPGLLRAKLVEEVEEYLRSGEPGELADVAELADIAEVLRALARVVHGMSPADLEALRASKAAARGGFELGIVLLPPGVAS